MKFFLLLLLALCHVTSAAVLKLESGQGKTEFKALGVPSSLRIDGHGEGPAGEMRIEPAATEGWNASGTLQISLKSLETGISLRDRHMKEKYLEVEKYENAQLEIQNLHLPADFLQSTGPQQISFQGFLTLHGLRKEVTGMTSISMSEGKLKMASQFSLKISDYGIQIPQFAGITVADEVRIEVNSEVPGGLTL